MAVGPEYVVDPPPRQAPLHGLVSSAVPVKEPESAVVGQERRPKGWRAGFVFLPDGCVTASVWDPCSTGEDRQKSPVGSNAPAVVVDPFFAELPFSCSTYGFKAVDYQARTLRMIEAAVDAAIEREFWTGEKMPQNQSLMGSTPNDDDHILNPGGAADPTPVSPALALTMLTQAIANCGTGARGMIHARAGLVEFWTQNTAVHEKDDLLITGARGDIVVAGTGYTGGGPQGQPDPPEGTEWAYATGIVAMWRDEPDINPPEFEQAIDRGRNNITFRGEQLSAVAHDGCCSFAVLVKSPSDDPVVVDAAGVEFPGVLFPDAMDVNVVSETRPLAASQVFEATDTFGGGGGSAGIDDGWLMLMVSAGGTPDSSARVTIAGSAYPLINDGTGAYAPVTITAPEGFVLGDAGLACEATEAEGSVNIVAVAFYPPG